MLLFVLAAVAAVMPLPGPLHAYAPAIHAGDTWRYRNTIEAQGRFTETHDEVSIVRLQGDAMLLRTHQVDSTLQPNELLIGSDWSRFRSVDGREQVVNRPFAFPLVADKTWTVEYTEEHPTRDHASEHFITSYRVVGVDRVTVPAGTFDAIKVEANGKWTATIAPATGGSIVARSDDQGATIVNRIDRRQAHDATGRLYKAFWYVPAIKRAVKVVEEDFSSGGVRHQSATSELEAFTPGG